MANPIFNPNMINETDLSTPTSAQKFPLGAIIDVADPSTKAIKKFMYVKSHGALTQYQPYQINIGITSGSEVITAAPATLAAPGKLIGVPQVAFTSGYYGFVQIQGNATCKKSSETYASGDHLQVLNAGTTAVVDGTSGSTAESVNSFAIVGATGSAAASVAVYLKGEPAVVAAT